MRTLINGHKLRRSSWNKVDVLSSKSFNMFCCFFSRKYPKDFTIPGGQISRDHLQVAIAAIADTAVPGLGMATWPSAVEDGSKVRSWGNLVVSGVYVSTAGWFGPFFLVSSFFPETVGNVIIPTEYI